MVIGSCAGCSRWEKEYYYDYLEEYFDEQPMEFPDPEHARGKRAVGFEATMRHTMRRALKKLDQNMCLQKLVCHLETQDDRAMEEDILMRIFPSEGCEATLLAKCTEKAEQMRDALSYYQRMVGLLFSPN